jgi:arylsulfatase A
LKRDLHEGGHRVPLFVRWPGVVPAARVSDALISQIDLFATIAAAVGAEIPAGSAEDSFNQLPLLRGESGSARETLVHNTNPDGYALRHRNWVLIAAKTGSISKVPDWFREANGYEENTLPGELYDLQTDPGQRNNLYATEPGRVQELTARLDQIRARSQVRPAN